MIRSSNKFAFLAAAILGGMLAPLTAHAELIYGLNDSGSNIFTINSSAPATVISGTFLTGLGSNEQIVSIDVRPSTGVLYGVSNFGKLYTINAITGATASVGTLSPATLNGVNFDADFDPTSSTTLRQVSDAAQNLSINATTAATTANPALAFGGADVHAGGATNIAGIAYSNNVSGAVTTTLYGIDSGFDALVTINGSTGVVSTVGGLGVNVSSVLGFDISSSGIAYAAMEPVNGSISNIYSINLASGVATLIGQVGGGFAVRDIALVNGGGAGVPEPTSMALVALAVPALLARRRRRA